MDSGATSLITENYLMEEKFLNPNNNECIHTFYKLIKPKGSSTLLRSVAWQSFILNVLISEAYQRVAMLQLGSSFIVIFAALSSAALKSERALNVIKNRKGKTQLVKWTKNAAKV